MKSRYRRRVALDMGGFFDETDLGSPLELFNVVSIDFLLMFVI
jgi:hypothetical protein